MFEGINREKTVFLFIASICILYGYYTFCDLVEKDRKGNSKTVSSISEEKFKASKIESADLQIKIYEIEENANNLEVALDDLNSKISNGSIVDCYSSMQNVHSKLSDVEEKLNELKSKF